MGKPHLKVPVIDEINFTPKVVLKAVVIALKIIRTALRKTKGRTPIPTARIYKLGP